jgi:hypothetical protein
MMNKDFYKFNKKTGIFKSYRKKNCNKKNNKRSTKNYKKKKELVKE